MLLARNNMLECDEKWCSVFAPKCVENLMCLIEIAKYDIIATSSWKYIDKYDGLLKMWQNRQIPVFLIGIIPNVSKHREDEIKLWLYQHGGNCSYVIIDDLDPDNFDEDQLDKHLLKTAEIAGHTVMWNDKRHYLLADIAIALAMRTHIL